MAAGDCTISGAYNIYTDKAVIELFIESVVKATISGADVFVVPAGAGNFYFGVIENLR